jgi:hypothetical protein
VALHNQQKDDLISNVDFWAGISNSLFKVGIIPVFNPIINRHEYIDFWKTQKRRCIEGYWHSGKWMPGPLYYYINFFHIKIQDKASVGENLGLPWLRDIDWELFLLYEECRGFSGFADDDVYTCNRFIGEEREKLEGLGIFDVYISEGMVNVEDLEKTYMPAREYLRKVFKKGLGKPLYQNSARHFISMQSRGGGKSYGTAGILAHNFNFGASTDYDHYLERVAEKKYPRSDTILGAIDTKYTKPLVDKVIEGYRNLPGGVEYLDQYFPSPLYSGFKGSLAENKDFKNDHGSVVYHRTFRNNPLAGNAGRPNLVAIDEIGFFDILAEAMAGIEGSQASQIRKRLVIWMLGTGGYVNGSSVNYVEHIFRDPEKYNCLSFDDQWENRGKIGYFVPITMTGNIFKKGENRLTDLEAASKSENMERESKKGDRKKYAGHIINAPLVPSEVFLLTEGTRFPTVLLKDQLQSILGGAKRHLLNESFKGWMKFNDKGEPYLHVEQDARPIRNYPIGKDNKGVEEDKEGAAEIFLKPVKTLEGVVPYGRYIGGVDVVAKDLSTTDSLPSVIIYDRLTQRIAAEYTGRTDDMKFFYEQVRRLALYYNAILMYEQQIVGLFTYFERHSCTYLLADTPYQLRNSDTYRPGTNTAKGINASNRVITTGIDWIASWLLQPVAKNSNILNLDNIESPAILQELIKWNPDGNFDRVSAMIMLFWHEETLNKVEKDEQERKITFLESDFFAKRGMLKEENDPILKELWEQRDIHPRKVM